ncbi:chromosome segregation protein SMC, partial [Aurantiacibacter xanthus]
ALAAHDQALAVGRERVSSQRADMKSWQTRAGDAAQRLAGMEARFEEIAEERAIVAAKPAGLIREIESGEEVRERLSAEL